MMSSPGARAAGATTLGSLFVGASVVQLTNRKLFAALVPERAAQYSSQLQVVTTIGLAGIGVSFIVPRLRPLARWSSTVMLTASLPAAVDQVRHPEQIEALGLPKQLALPRIIAQVLIVVLAWVVTRKR